MAIYQIDFIIIDKFERCWWQQPEHNSDDGLIPQL